MNGVSWLRNGTAEVITYTGVTTVEDDMVVLNEGATAAPTQAEMTDVYQWGYADVRVNGSQYGTVVNNPTQPLLRLTPVQAATASTSLGQLMQTAILFSFPLCVTSAFTVQFCSAQVSLAKLLPKFAVFMLQTGMVPVLLRRRLQ